MLYFPLIDILYLRKFHLHNFTIENHYLSPGTSLNHLGTSLVRGVVHCLNTAANVIVYDLKTQSLEGVNTGFSGLLVSLVI